MSLHEVEEGDTLIGIAVKFGFRDGGDAIWRANPELSELSGKNPDMLVAGTRIQVPERDPKSVSAGTGRTVHVRVRTCDYALKLVLCGPDGEGVAGWGYVARAEGMSEQKGQSDLDGVITLLQIPPAVRVIELELVKSGPLKAWGSNSEKIRVNVGSMTPILGAEKQARASIQKLLMNLGYQPDRIDGEISEGYRCAVASFQADQSLIPVSGHANQETCERLAAAACPTMHGICAPEANGDSDRNAPLIDLSRPRKRQAALSAFSQYEDPLDKSNNDDEQRQSDRRGIRFFPPEVHVAPSAPELGRWNLNGIYGIRRKVLFLDVGRWHKDDGARDFGLCWGRHAYLCRYHRKGDQPRPPFDRRKGLDFEFFSKLDGFVECVESGTASWAPESAFDWDHLHVIIPDLHLMTKAHADVWLDTDYQFSAERDLWQFAQQLKGVEPACKLRAIQIGDSYDLWVGYPRHFQRSPEGRRVEWLSEPDEDAEAPIDPDSYGVTLGAPRRPGEDEERCSDASPTISDRAAEVSSWIREIQVAGGMGSGPNGAAAGSRIGPAQEALKLLETALSMQYIWGNHDNYLAYPEVANGDLTPARRPWIQPNGKAGVFIEHGHRMEHSFDGCNYDGAILGWYLTSGLYWEMKHVPLIGGWVGEKAKQLDTWNVRRRDQPAYMDEIARVRVGREGNQPDRIAHICVIGHTHEPALYAVNIDPCAAYRPADAAVPVD